MKVSREEKDGIVILRLSGKLMGGADQADAVGNPIQAAIDEGKLCVIVDLADVGMINSTGIGILIVNHVRLQRADSALRLLHVSRRIDSVLMMTQLNTIFQSYNSEEEAIASCKQA